MKVSIDRDKCVGCGICSLVCPFGAIELKAGKAYVKDECRVCGKCLALCPADAISLSAGISGDKKSAYV